MSRTPFMRLFVGDYLADKLHLSTVEHGAYMLLIMAYWQNRGPLPADDASLARITRLSKLQWRKISQKILIFFEKKDEKIHHRRVDHEIARAADKSLKSRNAGLTSVERRLNGRSTPAQPYARVPETRNQNISFPSKDEKENAREGLSLFGEPEPPEAGSSKDDFLEFYEAFPRKVGRRDAEKAYDVAVRILMKGKPANRPRAVSLLLASAKAYAVLKANEDQKYIKTPGPWLRAGKWDDADVVAQREGKFDAKSRADYWNRMGK